MLVKDLQIIKFSVFDHPEFENALVNNALQTKITIVFDKQTAMVDKVQRDGLNGIGIINPTSITKFLYTIIYHCLEPLFHEDLERDNLSLSAYYLCNNYVYADQDEMDSKYKMPSVVLSFDKFLVPSCVLRYIYEPLVGNVQTPKILYDDFVAVDSCLLVNSVNEVAKVSKNGYTSLSDRDFPLLLVNRKIKNKASLYSDMLCKVLEHNFGSDKMIQILEEVISDKSVIEKLVVTLRTIDGDSEFIINFLRFLQTNCKLNNSLSQKVDQECCEVVAGITNQDFSVKTASDGKYTPQVFRQWTEWSMLMGLIEKQLESVRGSAWATSEAMKPFEDRHKALINDKAKKKNKKQLNFEELLETSREMFSHKAVQPGKVHEFMLGNNRVWR